MSFSPDSKAIVGKLAPDFKAGAVVDCDFMTLSLKDFRGQWVVLLFYPRDL
jgi:peroxiredoxin